MVIIGLPVVLFPIHHQSAARSVSTPQTGAACGALDIAAAASSSAADGARPGKVRRD
jgi:hypothetical protein